MTIMTANELRMMLCKQHERAIQARSHLGDGEREYMGELCSTIMQRIIGRSHDRHIEYRIETNVDADEQTIPEWLKDRASFVQKYFSEHGYQVNLNYVQERHGFGDYYRWHAADLRISW